MALRKGKSQIQQAQRRRTRESHEGKAMLQAWKSTSKNETDGEGKRKVEHRKMVARMQRDIGVTGGARMMSEVRRKGRKVYGGGDGGRLRLIRG